MSGWVAGSVVLSAGVSLYASDQATKAQTKANKAAMAVEERIATENREFQQEMADQQRSDFQPWRDAGEQALGQIQTGIESGAFEAGNIDLDADPGYRVRMQEGIDAIDASAASRGRLLSGAQKKALTQYGQEQGSKEYANAYARDANEKARRFNMLSGLSQGGQSSAAGQAQASSQLGQSTGNILTNLSRSQGQGERNIGAARAGGYQDQAQIVNQAAKNWLTYNMNTPSTTSNSNVLAGNPTNQAYAGMGVA